jgi:hypothetical protein
VAYAVTRFDQIEGGATPKDNREKKSDWLFTIWRKNTPTVAAVYESVNELP